MKVPDMGFKIAALVLWGVLFLQFVPSLLWAERANFRAVPSPLVRQMTRDAEGLLEAGLGLLSGGGHAVNLAGQIWR
jgi:hypothetical protein